MSLTPCRVKGLGSEARCGTLEVDEDRTHPGGRRIGLRVVLLPAVAPTPEPDPLFLLAGGPGQSIVEAAPSILPALERVRRRRDLVLVDQRGTGESHPLDCDTAPSDAGFVERVSAKLDPALFRTCLARYEADPRHYTTADAVEDLEAVRKALGLSRINLWAASYGTRLALEYIRRHGSEVRSAVLDGAAPPTQRLPLTFAPDAQRALDGVFDRCEREPECASAFPDLRARFTQHGNVLRLAPRGVTVDEPTRGGRQTFTLSSDRWTAALRGMLYLPETASLLPLTLDRAFRGDYGAFAALSEQLSSGFAKGMGLGLFASVVCAEDAQGVTPEEVDRAALGTFVGPSLGREILA
ncbi:MAG TPA: alpha/beta fold hydrolase, partial [Myxococcaceae bacterium]|nr:alpha/beta fold hydrolase [Myxococcaceae bacterium]